MAKQQSIFDEVEKNKSDKHAPLAHRMRPTSLSDFVGQEKLLSPDKVLYRMIETDHFSSMIFWGPAGTGKTTLARVIAETTGKTHVSFSAVISGIKEIKEVIAQARQDLAFNGKQTLLFIDEMHRFNKAQQDAFLPHIEDGTIIFIGATTENPSFEINTPLLSRTHVFVFEGLSNENIREICLRALDDSKRGLAKLKPVVSEKILDLIVNAADGDARSALNNLEMVVIATKPDESGKRIVTREKVSDVLERRILHYDKSAEEHYNLISALHKAMRGSDPQGSIYWLVRMLEGGEDPLFIARRMVRFASEDIGMADPQALVVAMAARDAFHFIGLPEGALALVHAAVYLATAPKSNRLYTAQKETAREIKKSGSLPVPLHIRNAPTDLMKDVGYGQGYQYAHDLPEALDTQSYLPEKLLSSQFYYPSDRGFEKTIRERLEAWQKKRIKRLDHEQTDRGPEDQ